jgi:hypothetical protein
MKTTSIPLEQFLDYLKRDPLWARIIREQGLDQLELRTRVFMSKPLKFLFVIFSDEECAELERIREVKRLEHLAENPPKHSHNFTQYTKRRTPLSEESSE